MSTNDARRRPTIMEVAKLAGVSHQTVSRYLRYDGGMKAATRERISAAIKELEYRPNLIARAMRDRRTGRLAILLPAGTAVSSLEMLVGATNTAAEAGYVVEVITLNAPSVSLGNRVLELSDSGLFEGILSLTPLPQTAQAAGTVPVVVAPHYDDQMRSIGELADGSPIAELIEGLAEQGHRRFLHLAGTDDHTCSRERRRVYLETIQRLGLESHGVIDTLWSPQISRDAILELPREAGVTAVICANDGIAAGAIRGAWERGWKVPADLSVTGWGNYRVAEILPPAFTTVATDHELLGRQAIAQLLAVLSGETCSLESGAINQVIWRESTGPVPE